MLRDNHLGRCRNITSHRPAPRSAPGESSTAHPRHHTHTIDHTVAHTGLSLHSTGTVAVGSLQRARRAACAMNADALAAVRRGPGRATADGRRSPPAPARLCPCPDPRAQPSPIIDKQEFCGSKINYAGPPRRKASVRRGSCSRSNGYRTLDTVKSTKRFRMDGRSRPEGSVQCFITAFPVILASGEWVLRCLLRDPLSADSHRNHVVRGTLLPVVRQRSAPSKHGNPICYTMSRYVIETFIALNNHRSEPSAAGATPAASFFALLDDASP
ncbi:jg2596 [Pararge aegeria aegeria]|uniref:Jg2596 protein n=1 Tax=Pararge aegeria aegeria TaxID=348720 RepID=A0A8S4S2D2_9NEOP|nr:jg2596 [Pararge aegeria aegeria]